MDLEIRPATPDDADAAVPLIYSSGPAVLDYIFTVADKRDVFGCMRRGFERNEGELGFGAHTVATMDNRVVATGATYTSDDAFQFMLHGARNIVAFYGLVRGAGVLRRALQVERVVKPPTMELLYVGHLGVAPELRGKGIGEELVRYLLDASRRKGRAIAALDVSVENPRAQALYERLGFVVTRECPSTLRNRYATVPSHRRMELNLSSGP